MSQPYDFEVTVDLDSGCLNIIILVIYDPLLLIAANGIPVHISHPYIVLTVLMSRTLRCSEVPMTSWYFSTNVLIVVASPLEKAVLP